MRGVLAPDPGGPDALRVVDLPDPVAGPGEVVIDVVAAGLNRADLLQRQGFYPPPRGASDVLGLECSGTIASVGEDVEGWQPGQACVALLAGGGYATQVVVPAGQVMAPPPGLDPVTAAGVPEVAATVWSNVFMTAGLQPGNHFLVHGGAGGIGTFAIQAAKALGAEVSATAGTADKVALVERLGARGINYKDQDFAELCRNSCDVILDNMGAAYLERNVQALATEGRLVVIGLQGGAKAELNLGALLTKRAAVIATSLRARPTEQKATICRAVEEHVWPLIGSGEIEVLVHEMFALDDVAEAHRAMESGEHTGKIVLRVSG